MNENNEHVWLGNHSLGPAPSERSQAAIQSIKGEEGQLTSNPHCPPHKYDLLTWSCALFMAMPATRMVFNTTPSICRGYNAFNMFTPCLPWNYSRGGSWTSVESNYPWYWRVTRSMRRPVNCAIANHSEDLPCWDDKRFADESMMHHIQSLCGL